MPKEIVSGLMTISRMAGFMAHWREAMGKFKASIMSPCDRVLVLTRVSSQSDQDLEADAEI